MKKFFRTTLHESALDLPSVFVSAGKRGYQVELTMDALAKMIPFGTADLIRS